MAVSGVNPLLRKAGGAVKKHEEWEVDGKTITLKMTSTLKNHTMTFELGQEIDEITLDGRNVRVTQLLVSLRVTCKLRIIVLAVVLLFFESKTLVLQLSCF